MSAAAWVRSACAASLLLGALACDDTRYTGAQVEGETADSGQGVTSPEDTGAAPDAEAPRDGGVGPTGELEIAGPWVVAEEGVQVFGRRTFAGDRYVITWIANLGGRLRTAVTTVDPRDGQVAGPLLVNPTAEDPIDAQPLSPESVWSVAAGDRVETLWTVEAGSLMARAVSPAGELLGEARVVATGLGPHAYLRGAQPMGGGAWMVLWHDDRRTEYVYRPYAARVDLGGGPPNADHTELATVPGNVRVGGLAPAVHPCQCDARAWIALWQIYGSDGVGEQRLNASLVDEQGALLSAWSLYNADNFHLTFTGDALVGVEKQWTAAIWDVARGLVTLQPDLEGGAEATALGWGEDRPALTSSPEGAPVMLAWGGGALRLVPLDGVGLPGEVLLPGVAGGGQLYGYTVATGRDGYGVLVQGEDRRMLLYEVRPAR